MGYETVGTSVPTVYASRDCVASRLVSDIDVVRAIYDAMAGRDFDRLFQLIDPECVVTQDPALPWGGRHVGHDGYATFGLTLTSTIDSAVTHEALSWPTAT